MLKILYLKTVLALSLAMALFAVPAEARRIKIPEVFKIQGDSPALSTVGFPLKEAFQNEADMQLQVMGELSAVKGLEELDRGIGDALIVAMSFEELNKRAADAGLVRLNKPLTQHTVLLNEVSYSIIVNPANPVQKLSDKELRRLFSGRYKDWDDVDGTKGAVHVVWGEWSTGASWILADRIMDDEMIMKSGVKAESTADIVAKVSADPQAIGIIPTAALTPAVKAVQTSELKIEGPLIMVTVGFPLPKHFQLIKLIKGDGRQLVGY